MQHYFNVLLFVGTRTSAQVNLLHLCFSNSLWYVYSITKPLEEFSKKYKKTKWGIKSYENFVSCLPNFDQIYIAHRRNFKENREKFQKSLTDYFWSYSAGWNSKIEKSAKYSKFGFEIKTNVLPLGYFDQPSSSVNSLLRIKVNRNYLEMNGGRTIAWRKAVNLIKLEK